MLLSHVKIRKIDTVAPKIFQNEWIYLPNSMRQRLEYGLRTTKILTLFTNHLFYHVTYQRVYYQSE